MACLERCLRASRSSLATWSSSCWIASRFGKDGFGFVGAANVLDPDHEIGEVWNRIVDCQLNDLPSIEGLDSLKGVEVSVVEDRARSTGVDVGEANSRSIALDELPSIS